MSETTFDLHEDDWGMVALEPRENLAHRQRTIAEAVAHADAHRSPDGLSYSALYVAPEPEVDLAIRAITLDALAALLGPAWRRYDRVASGYSSYREDVPEAFAFHLADRFEEFEDGSPAPVFYGTTENGVVTSLNVHHPCDVIANELATLGATFALIVVDLWRDQVVDLADAAACSAYVRVESSS
jgi:hypothetical protein